MRRVDGPWSGTRHWPAAVLLALCCGLAPLGAVAQVGRVPDAKEMIEALKPSGTRGVRNLVVRPKVEAAATGAAGAASTVPIEEMPSPASGPPAAQRPPSLSLAIQFENNSSQVRPESGPILGNLVAALQSSELKGVRFAVEGHTDANGAPARNLALSQQRAEEVRLYLIALGVHPGRLKAVGKGATDLANPFDPLAAENRRVRVVTLE